MAEKRFHRFTPVTFEQSKQWTEIIVSWPKGCARDNSNGKYCAKLLQILNNEFQDKVCKQRTLKVEVDSYFQKLVMSSLPTENKTGV